VGRNTRSPSAPPPRRSSTAAATRAHGGRGSAGPRRGDG
jgi:hypothetical protein